MLFKLVKNSEALSDALKRQTSNIKKQSIVKMFLISLLLDVGDRNDNNIMVRSDGVIFNIDFQYELRFNPLNKLITAIEDGDINLAKKILINERRGLDKLSVLHDISIESFSDDEFISTIYNKVCDQKKLRQVKILQEKYDFVSSKYQFKPLNVYENCVNLANAVNYHIEKNNMKVGSSIIVENVDIFNLKLLNR